MNLFFLFIGLGLLVFGAELIIRGSVSFGKMMIGMEFIFLRKGVMTMGASQLCGFAKSDSSRSTPNLQFHVQPIRTDKLGGSNLHDFDAFTPTVANLSLIHISKPTRPY